MSFGWIKFNRKKDKTWWKRKEYKIPEEHFKLFNQPNKAVIKRFQKNFSYHNSSQFRHWILGASVLLAFVTLGCSFNKADTSSLNPWICGKRIILPKVFCLMASEEMVHNFVMNRGTKLWKYLNSIQHQEISRKHSYAGSKNEQESFEKIDAPEDDDEWETIEGMLHLLF